MQSNDETFDVFTLIPLDSPLSRVEADDYGLSFYINETIMRSGLNHGQFCSAGLGGSLACVGNGSAFLQFSSDMAYFVQSGTMYLCYDNHKVPYKTQAGELIVDAEGYVQTIQNETYAVSAKPMRHQVARGARFQTSQKNAFIICPGCVHAEEEESEDDGGGEDGGNGGNMPGWEIALIVVVSAVGAGFLGVLVWYLAKNKTQKGRVRLDAE